MAEGTVRIELVGPMRRPEGACGPIDVPVAGPVTVDALLEGLGYRPMERRVLRVLRDDEPLRLDDTVAPGAALIVFLPVGGG